MGRILAIDYGTKRTGLAWTDALRLSVNPLTALTPDAAFDFIQQNIQEIDLIVIGMPLDSQGKETDATESVINFRNRLKNAFPETELVAIDERHTSREAREYLIRLGYKKKDRENKENIDKVAAALILQRYLDGI